MRYFVHCTHPDGRTVGFAGLSDTEAEKTAASWGRDGYECKITSDAAMRATSAAVADAPRPRRTARKGRTGVTTSTRILDVEGKPGSFVIEMWIESDPHWIEFATQARDIFGSTYGIGYWARGMEHDPKLGWLVYEHGGERRAPAEPSPAVLKAWRDGGDLPRYWYRIDTACALRAQAEGVRLRGVDWYEGADMPFYDCILQRAIFGEEKYG